MPQIGQELLNVPFPDLVRNLGLAIAEAQMALDVTSMRLAQFMAGYVETTDEEGNTQVERKTLRFTLDDRHLAIWNREMREVVEPGPVVVSAGNSSASLKQAEFTIA